MVPNYNFYPTNVSSNKGGVCLFIKNTISCKQLPTLCIKKDHFESIFVECIISGKPIVIGMCYRRPGTPINCFQNELSRVIELIKGNCILMGDFNLNMLNYDRDINVKNYSNLMTEYSYIPVITKPTRVKLNSISLLDQIWVNFEQAKPYQSKIILSDITDHFPVLFHYSLPNTSHNKKVITFRKRGENCDNLFKTNLENSTIHEVLLENDAESAFNIFNDKIYELYYESYPLIVKNVSLNSLKKHGSLQV